MNRVTIVGAGCNLALSGIKAAGGIMGGSTVLVADVYIVLQIFSVTVSRW